MAVSVRRCTISKKASCGPTTGPALACEVDASKLTKIGGYDTYRAGMLLNQRPDGSFTNW